VADIRRSLSMVLERNAIPIPLEDRKFGLRVASILDLELRRTARFVLAAKAQLPTERLQASLPTLVKIGPGERIRDLVNLNLPGIVLRSLPVAPRQIPFHAGFLYFELERSGDLWKQTEQSGLLALHIAGEFPGLELEYWSVRGQALPDDPFAGLGLDRTVMMPTPGGRVPPPAASPEQSAPAATSAVTSGLSPLVGAATPLLNINTQLRAYMEHPDANAVRERLAHGIRDFEVRARAAGAPTEKV